MKKFLTRTVSGAVFVAIVLASLLWRAEAFGLVFLFFTAEVTFEYLRITVKEQFPVSRIIALLAGMSLFFISWAVFALGISPKCLLAVPAFIPILLITILAEGRKDDYGAAGFLFCSIIYIALPFSLTNLIAFNFDSSLPGWVFNGKTILALFILVWASDAGAYLFGMTLGKVLSKKLCPAISPNKTWIGFFGGLICTLLTGWILSSCEMFGFGLFHTMVIAILVDLFGVTGDLAESQLKRKYGIKDSGTIMPGHGGLLDRFDATISAIPIAIAYIYLFTI